VEVGLMAKRPKRAAAPATAEPKPPSAAASWARRLGLPSLGGAQIAQLGGVAMAVVVAVLVNIIAARHYKRWDATSNKRYSLTPATVETLRGLGDAVHVWVLVGSSDPLSQSVKQILVAYQAETTKLDVHYVDPDRDLVALEDLRKRFKIETGRTEQGNVVTDAIMIVAHGDRHWFLSPSDMVEVRDPNDPRVKPREEQAITGAIRNVLGGDKAALCFTAGHGEMGLDDGSERGLAHLKVIVEKDNFAARTVDTSAPNATEPFAGCSVVVVAGLRSAFTKDETERLRTYLMGGGNALFAVSPLPGGTETGLVDVELARALAPFGVALDEDLVIEEDARLVVPKTGGLRFFVTAKEHPVTAALAREGADVPRVVTHFSRSLKRSSEPDAPNAAPLLTTSAASFGLVSIVGAADWTDAPSKKSVDLAGPLTLAMAAERPKVGAAAPHGPRVVVLGSASYLTSPNWREPTALRGAAMLVESSLSWLASKPQILDVPTRAEVPAGIRVTDEARSDVRRYVLVFMPGTVALLGLAVGLLRRAGEGERRGGKKKAGAKARDKRADDEGTEDAEESDDEPEDA
jgi:hypothetical protein